MSSKIGTLELLGASGQKYTFSIYPIGINFKAVGGIYYISRRADKGNHSSIYIGETGDLSERFDNHHKSDCFEKYKANCISVYANDSRKERLAIEQDLIANYQPPCNG